MTRERVNGRFVSDGPPKCCSTDGCDRAHHSAGLCVVHYQRSRRGSIPDAPVRRSERGRTCTIEGCGEPHKGRGLCLRHYNHARYAAPDSPIRDHRTRGTCEADGCDRSQYGGGLCMMHYGRRRRTQGRR